MLSLGLGPWRELPDLALQLVMGVALKGCFAPGKAGNGASASPEGCFYVNKKKTAPLQTWPALGQTVWQRTTRL